MANSVPPTGTPQGPQGFLPSGAYGGTTPYTGGALNYDQNGSTTPGSAGYNYGGYGAYSSGQQPGGNNYPAGIYGPGPNGSGTALGTVTPDELTSNQLTGLIADNSQYIQQARNNANAQANSRGLLNGSLAAGNAQAAAIQAALPIANANASTISGLQTTNLNNLSKTQTANIAADAQMTSAGISAGAQMNIAAQNNAGALLRQQDNNAYLGEQAELGYQRSSALMDQQYSDAYQNSIGLGAFNLGATLLQGQQNFYDSAGLAAMNNPAIMGDPESFGGYMQFISNPFSNTLNNIFNSPMFSGLFSSGGAFGGSSSTGGSP